MSSVLYLKQENLAEEEVFLSEPVRILKGSRMGRNEGCHIVISKPEVSRFHGIFSFEKGDWYYTDNKSRNGTEYLASGALKYVTIGAAGAFSKVKICTGDQLMISGVSFSIISNPKSWSNQDTVDSKKDPETIKIDRSTERESR